MSWLPHWGQAEATPSAAVDDQAQTEALLDKIAQTVVSRRLEVPAVMFLEMHRPLSFLGSQALYFFTPLLGLVARPEQISRLARLLDTSEGVERLISAIEQKSRAASNKKSLGKESAP
jgi:ABC-type Fe3+-hydroxamate transport system substrate-binding protein